MENTSGLTKWRVEKAESALSSAKKNLEINEYATCLNRSYYAVFYAMQAANSLYGYDSRKHSGVISFFRKTFLKGGLLSTDLSDMITETSKYRERADYEDMYEASEEIARLQLENADVFVKTVIAYVRRAGSNNGLSDF